MKHDAVMLQLPTRELAVMVDKKMIIVNIDLKQTGDITWSESPLDVGELELCAGAKDPHLRTLISLSLLPLCSILRTILPGSAPKVHMYLCCLLGVLSL